MTLIVGLVCEDGVVVGADGAATFGSMGQFTSRQPTRKLEIVSEHVIVGVSGPVGLGQLIQDKLRSLWTAKAFGAEKCPTPAAVMRLLRNEFWQDVGAALSAAQQASAIIGQAALGSAISTSMVALPVGGEPVLITFDQQCAPEEATKHLPFVAIGSGQAIADPFLAFLRRIYWKDALPSLAEGIFAATWTLVHAIDTNPGGVSDPIQLMVLERSGKTWNARELTDAELSEHRESVSAAELHLHEFRMKLGEPDGDSTASVPLPGQSG